MKKETLNLAADNIRIPAASMVEKAKSGHPRHAMGGADFINVLYSEYLVFDPADPTWNARDRFFLDPATWLRCSMPNSPSSGNSLWTNSSSSASGEAPQPATPSLT